MTSNGNTVTTTAEDLATVVQNAAKTAVAEFVATQAGSAGPSIRRVRVADLVAEILAGPDEPSRRTYAPYVTLLVTGWEGHEDVFAGLGAMWADEVLPKDLKRALEAVSLRATARVEERNEVRAKAGRHTRETGGTSPAYNAVGAWRWLFSYAEDNRYIPAGSNPARAVPKPTRNDGARMALTEQQLEQVVAVASSTGDDPELDTMLIETILVTGARREGMLNMRLDYLDPDECTVLLDEKNGKKAWQPVPGWFFDKLAAFAVSRGATKPADHVFRKLGRDGVTTTLITGRRFDNLFCKRLQSLYEWADKQQVAAHTIRHHAITLIERHAGHAVAQRFARHENSDTTGIYTMASELEVARAVVGLYGGNHPWLSDETRRYRA